MPFTIHLGVIEEPYDNSEGGSTTGDVAEILEAKYGIMSAFMERHGQQISGLIEDSLVGAMENMLLAGPGTADPLAVAESKIEHLFKEFLSTGEIEQMGIPGVPTKAALKGRSLRLKIKRGAPRPSFIDSGKYEDTFRAWSDQS